VPSTIDDARQLIQSRRTEIEAEAAQLRRAIAGLGDRGGSRPRRRAHSAKAASPVKSSRTKAAGKDRRRSQAPRGQRHEQLFAAIKSMPGAQPSELAREIGVSASQVHGLLAKARAEKLIVKKGPAYFLKS
jgi:hypothetical protein